MKKFLKNICVFISLLLSIVICFSGCGKSESKSKPAKPYVPAQSGDSSFNANPNTSDTETPDSQDNSSKEESDDESSAVSDDEGEQRVEKVIKTYKLVEEFEAPLYEKLTFKDTQSGKSLPYSLHLPENYSKNKKYPVLLLLHGRGAQGTDYYAASGEFSSIFKYNGDLVSNSIVVIPQTPDWWTMDETGKGDGWLDAAMRMLFHVEKTYSCDLDRIYVMGLSMGGYGTWSLLSQYGDHFAAGVPICGGGDPSNAKKLANIPIWIYHGEADPTVPIATSETMYNAIVNAGGKKIHFTRLPGVKHDSWLNAFKSRELLSWLYSQNKSKNKDGSFEVIPFFKITDSKGKTIITEYDTEGISLVETNGKEQLEFMLTDAAVKKLGNAYKNSGGKSFDVYYGTKKLLTFTATKKPTDNLFIINDIFNSKNYYWYYNRIAMIMGY